MNRYYTPECFAALETVTAYADLAKIGIGVLTRMKAKYPSRKIIQICGPMSTGGLGDLALNMAMFSSAIAALDAKRYALEEEVVFDQVPCQTAIKRIARFDPQSTTYDDGILTDFYRPLFATGLISVGYFLPGWESSYGARWEREEIRLHGIRVDEYPDDLYRQLLADMNQTK